MLGRIVIDLDTLDPRVMCWAVTLRYLLIDDLFIDEKKHPALFVVDIHRSAADFISEHFTQLFQVQIFQASIIGPGVEVEEREYLLCDRIRVAHSVRAEHLVFHVGTYT
jgi:hypothetical protein